uniref:ABC transmembrane type-1 domain-containing protein n=1 Tax=Glossina palpalis gambiensis TaxID=67801 RepID=A0A1B0C7B6_9MUSC
MEKGRVSAVGSYESLRESGLDFSQLLAEPEKDHSANNTIRSCSLNSCLEETPQQVQETQEEGQIGFYLYKKYFKAGGGIFMFIVMLTFCIMSQILGSAGALTDLPKNGTEVPTADNSHNIESQISGFLSQYNVYIDREMTDIYVFTIITVATIAITVPRCYLFFNMAMKASTNAAAMYFFNTNPSGRILNIFSKDMGQIDEILPSVMIDVIQIFLTHSKEEANADKEIYKDRIAAYAAQLEEANADKEIHTRRIAAYEAQLEPQPDNVVANIEELREVVKCLTTEDKIVQITFDEVFTNNLDDKQKETYPCKTIFVFGVRSLATASNLILSVNPLPPSKPNVLEELILKNIDTAKQIGLDVRVVVCDHNKAYGKTMEKLPHGVVHLYDYIHILKNLKDNGEKMKDEYDYSILTKLYKLEETTSKFWILRGAIVNAGVPWYFPELVQFFNNSTTGILEAGIKEGDFKSDTEMAKRTFKLFKAITSFVNIFHRSCITTQNVDEVTLYLKEVTKDLLQMYIKDVPTIALEETAANFSKLMIDLMKAYPDTTFTSFRVSQDLLEAFFINIGKVIRKKALNLNTTR